jgi:TldD protein
MGELLKLECPNCGKGQPSQSAHVGHGTNTARFRNVQVEVKK